MGYRVVALSSGPAKREDCLKLGAFAYLDASKVDQGEELQKLGGAKVVMMCAPVSDASTLIKGVGYDGTLLVLAAGQEPSTISLCACSSIPFYLLGLWADLNFSLAHP